MEYVVKVCQALAALGILNVWLLRSRKATAYRGGEAQDMKEEFAVYGLPVWFMYAIGILKVTLAVLLLVGLWAPVVSRPAAGGLAASGSDPSGASAADSSFVGWSAAGSSGCGLASASSGLGPTVSPSGLALISVGAL